ncbi:MAG: agmatine deiminase [Anaerophaga sp.]|nr:agmatine deiminase [Anaerophaga sp.]
MKPGYIKPDFFMDRQNRKNRILPAEWESQDAVLLAWPHEETDWEPMLQETRDCFRKIIDTITRFEDVVLLVDDNDQNPSSRFRFPERLQIVKVPVNDTWARDFGPLLVKENRKYIAVDFKFNGWGLKFAADKDNLITQRLFENRIFSQDVVRENRLNFVLEGGSIESDGKGTVLTTSRCLLSPNRNGRYSKNEIEDRLKQFLGANNILWLENGYLAGDDTDSHIDTLARFCDPGTIVYIKTDNPEDEHFEALNKMENQLRKFKTTEGKSYNLIPLPMADPVYHNNQRLPATYANFLIINHAVLVPFYNSPKDIEAKKIFEKIFPNREVIGIDCRPLIKQNGSLHCVTMQLPQGSLKKQV